MQFTGNDVAAIIENALATAMAGRGGVADLDAYKAWAADVAPAVTQYGVELAAGNPTAAPMLDLIQRTARAKAWAIAISAETEAERDRTADVAGVAVSIAGAVLGQLVKVGAVAVLGAL